MFRVSNSQRSEAALRAWQLSLVFVLLTVSTLAAARDLDAENAKSHKSKNHLSFLTGTSYVPDHSLSAFTAGIDFERELSHTLGIGVVAEHAFGELDATSVFLVADIHLGHGFVVQVGPGVEFIDSRTLAVGRVGVFQELHFGDLVIAPSLSYDFTKAEDTLVFAVAVGSRF